MPEIIETPALRDQSVMAAILDKAHKASVPMIPEKPVAVVAEAKKPEEIANPANETLTKEIEAAQTRVKELEAQLAGKDQEVSAVASLKEAQALWKQGKKIEAIAKLSEVDDPDVDLDDVVAEWMKRPAKASKNPTDEKLEEVIKRLDAEAEEKKAQKEQAAKDLEQKTKDAKTKAEKDTLVYAGSVLDTIKDKFELCDLNRDEACAKAAPIALAILKRDKINLDTLTKAESDKAMTSAFAEMEKDYEKQAAEEIKKREDEIKRWTKGKKPDAAASSNEPAKTEDEDQTPPTAKAAPIKLVPGAERGTLEAILERARRNATY